MHRSLPLIPSKVEKPPVVVRTNTTIVVGARTPLLLEVKLKLQTDRFQILDVALASAIVAPARKRLRKQSEKPSKSSKGVLSGPRHRPPSRGDFFQCWLNLGPSNTTTPPTLLDLVTKTEFSVLATQDSILATSRHMQTNIDYILNYYKVLKQEALKFNDTLKKVGFFETSNDTLKKEKETLILCCDQLVAERDRVRA
ncbi:hypothetical protein GOBAR_DD19917 [Gossypium barbadense]|nr:hypothetical protein GOBAR_DD19917 [Gossypium barbadense]